MVELHPSLRELAIPPRIARRPRDRRGYPVPWFVARVDDDWDFRCIAPGKMTDAIQHRRCWLCGDQLGVNLVFAIGPMCVVNRTTSEPPAHRDCAEFAVQACPFLTNPDARYRDRGLPEPHFKAAGFPSARNPGVVALYITRDYQPIKSYAGHEGTLIRLGKPSEVTWWHRGREATRQEVLAAIASGLPGLRAMAEREGPISLAQLLSMHQAAQQLLPAA